MIAVDIFDVPKPIVYKTMFFLLDGRLNTTASIVTTNNNVFNF